LPAPELTVSAPDDAPISSGDRQHVDCWLRGEAGGKISESELSGRLAIVRKMAPNGFDWLVRNNLTAGSIAVRRGWVADADPGIMATRMRAEWSDPASITRRVATWTSTPESPSEAKFDLLGIRLLGALVSRWAPQNAHLVPDPESVRLDTPGPTRQPTPAQRSDIRADDGVVKVDRPPDDPPGAVTPEFSAAFETKHGRKLGALTPEQLAAVRAPVPGLREIAEREAHKAAVAKLVETVPEQHRPFFAWDAEAPS
jgi:hypothetical protein